MAAKVKKVVELIKDDSKILITVLEGDQVASCVEEETKKYCEACQCDEGMCDEWIEHLKSKGYQATEVRLGEMDGGESLPRFLEDRRAAAAAGVDLPAPQEPSAAVAEPEAEAAEEESAVSEPDQALP